MKIKASIYLFIAALFIPALLKSRTQPAAPALNSYNLSAQGSRVYELPKALREVSGMAIAKGDRVFLHNDEKGRIFEFSLKTGDIIKEFHLGSKPVPGDFEDIAVYGTRFYLTESDGTILAFNEGADKTGVEYKVMKTGLDESYDIEGLEYEPKNASLLIACKGKAGKGMKHKKAVYEFFLKEGRLESKPRFLLDEKYISEKLGIRHFSPSAIKRHPVTGSYFILSAREQAIVEISAGGEILAMKKLNSKWHPQPEALAFLSDRSLLIGDESGIITRYEYAK